MRGLERSSACWVLAVCCLLGCGDDAAGRDPADDEVEMPDGGDVADSDQGARPRPGSSAGDEDGDGDGDGDDGAHAQTDAGASRTPLPCDVAGVLEGHCIRCHGARLQQGAPMPLLSWEDLQARAPSDLEKSVYERVAARITALIDPMPPATEPRPGDAQVDAIINWIDDGAPPGENPNCLLPR